jgi:AcrR family transcriptional regulator
MAQRIRTRLAREERREQIVDAAAEVFQGRDPAEVTFEEIADAAGVSRALVYNYFGDRHGLLEAVYRRNIAVLSEGITKALVTTRGRREALAASVRVHLEFATTNEAGYRYATGDLVFARLPELEHEQVADVAANFGGGPDAAIVARGLMSATQAMVLYWLDHPSGDVEHAAELITSFLYGGLADVDTVGVHLTPRWSVPR